MKKFLKSVSVLLCLSLLLGLAACVEVPSVSTAPGTTASTVPAQTTVPTAPTQTTVPAHTTVPDVPPVDALSLYTAAAAAVEEMTDLCIGIERTDEVSTLSQTLVNVFDQTVTYRSRNTDSVRVSVVEDASYNGNAVDIQETFVDGTAYAIIDNIGFASTMTAEDYIARLLPVVVVDPTLYASIEQELVGEETVISFREATGLENWLASEVTELLSARADVTLRADGSLKKVEFSASYLLANTPVTTTVTVTYHGSANNPVSAPANGASYPRLAYFDAPRIQEQAYGYMLEPSNVSFDSNITTYVSAAAFYMYQGCDIDVYDFSSNPQLQVTKDIYFMDYYTEESLEQTLEERYLNGRYTYTQDDQAEQTVPGITDTQMQEYALGLMLHYLIVSEFMTDAVCTDLGSLLLVEFTGSSDLGNMIVDEICTEVYSDPDLLDNACSAYRTDTMEYYIAVDKYLGIPTAIGMNFQGTHTIDGYEYPIIRQVDQAIYLDSLDAYKAINEVAAPGEEPEEKATPVFYHVTGPDGEEMWLLGTIHVGDDRTGYLPQEIYDAFERADALALECDSRLFEEQMEADEALQEQVSGLYYYSDGSEAASHLDDPELYDLAVKMMKATGNYFYNAPYLKVAMWSNSITNFFIRQGSGLSSDKGVDNRLQELADQTGKKIIEVESTLFQIKMLTGWSDGLSQWQLEDAVNTHGVGYCYSLLEMYDLWCSGDEAALIEYLKDDTTGLTDEELAWWNEYNTAMSTDRNADMAKTAIGYLESGETVFMAVGLAHVLAEDGLVNALRAAGYTVELVEYSE